MQEISKPVDVWPEESGLGDVYVFPASFEQRRLWFLDQLEPGSAAYSLPMLIRCSGPLDPALLEQALNGVVARHESLRTTFSVVDGELSQTVAPRLRIPLLVVDLRGLDAEVEGRALAATAARRPFDLAQGPLLRGFLARLDEKEWFLFLVLHHIVADGWSIGILLKDLLSLYRDFESGGPPSLPDLPIQYADFALWQQDWLRGEVLEQRLQFWKAQLAGAPGVLQLPADHPVPSRRTRPGGKLDFYLPAELSEALVGCGREHGATTFMVLLAAFLTLLYRYTGQDDLTVGTPVANRLRPETRDLIGFFANTLVLRGDLAGDPPFQDLLQRVRAMAIDAFEHQDIPFEKLVEELAPERSLTHTPLFQVVFVLQNAALPVNPVAGLKLRPVGVYGDVAKFDLTLTFEETPDQLIGFWEYDRELFEEPTILRMNAHLRALLRGVAEAPWRRLSELPLLSPEERRQLLSEWSPASGSATPPGTLHELFALQAARTPEAVAVSGDDAALSYADLDRRAEAWAASLRRLGVGPEVRVGLAMERSAEMVVAILAVVKAGGAYVPLDPEYPQERLAFLLADSRIRVLLIQERLRERLPAGDVRVLSVDRGDLDRTAAEDRSLRVPGGPLPGNAAYVIYTSGSSGQPKGVVVTHANAVSLFAATRELYRFGEDDVWTLFHSYAFDFSVWEIWGSLLHGGRLVVVPFWTSRSPEAFRELLVDEGVTVLNQTPSAFRQLIQVEERGEAAGPLSLRWVIFGGEALELSSLAPWFERHGDERPRLVNMYGITETTVHVTFRPLALTDLRAGRSLVGRPLSSLRLHILDRGGDLAPIGVPGEIHVGGEGVSRGYLSRPDLTAGRFVPDPFGDSGSRLYRSGDLARWLPEGDLEYLGRIDSQVKVRGFRIELGEIEAALTAHPAIREAVVAAREDKPGDRRLIAYIVCRETAPDAADLRAWLKERLPEPMIPAGFVALAALPLTPHGKVDRKALPAPEPAADAPSASPRTPVEVALAAIWSEVLGLPCGIFDDFFTLGGHSLLATQLVSRVRESFGVELALRELFEAPTVASLAARIAGRERVREAAAAPPLRPSSRSRDLPLSFAQERLWFLDQLNPGTSSYNIPLTLRLNGELSIPALSSGLTALVARHEALRTTFALRQGRPAQVVAPAAAFPLPLVDLAALPALRRDAAAMELAGLEAARHFNLFRGPLLRSTLLRLDSQSHLLLLTLHHIVADGWSMGVLLRDLGEIYAALIRGEAPRLPALTVQYADFAIWQRSWLTEEVLRGHLAWWRERLAGAPDLLDLPFDRPRPLVAAAQSRRSAYVAMPVPSDLCHRLGDLARAHGATSFMVLLAAFQALLSRLSGQEDLLLGSPVANRDRIETEALIGFFVNSLVLRADLSGDPEFAGLLARVRETTLDTYAHQDLPFEKLVEALQPDRRLGQTPFFQTVFAMQNAPATPPIVPGVVFEASGAPVVGAKFDLTLVIMEAPQGLAGSWEYDPDLFDAATVTRMAAAFGRVLSQVAARPHGLLGDLDLLSEWERHQLLWGWNDTGSSYPLACLPELFQERARVEGERVAAVCGGESLTYGELDHRSGLLAGYLRGLGVLPGERVGLLVERSLEMLVGILGILKAGGSYVPLDPGHPVERLGWMLSDAGASLVLTQERLLGRLPGSWVPRVCLDRDWAEISSSVAWGGEAGWSPESPAYVMYTSGSTGKPKGVSVPHRAVVRLVCETGFLRFGASEVWLQWAPISFDASTLEIWGALLHGSRLVLMPPGLPTLESVGELVRREGVTALWLTAGVFNQMVDGPLELLSGVGQLLAGGDALSPSHVRRALERLPGTRLINGYGPTENTTFTCTHGMPDGSWPVSTVPIGRPISSTQAYVLDGGLRPVPIGVAGELYAGGAGLAQGYLGSPELTAVRFVPNPFGEPGSRLYRTGDRVRLRGSGELEFLGRLDQQVKLRGFRVEPGEVESALSSCPGVERAAVVVREDLPGGRGLLACVVGEAERAPSDLREWLRSSLPEPLVPAHFLWLESLPLTANGKVDRRALERLPLEASGGERGLSAAPRTPLEQLLVDLWAELLGLERIGIDDDFFELGGHSLLATRMASRVRETFGMDLPLRNLFETPTVAGLAASMEAMLAQERGLAAPAIVPVERSGRLPLSFAQERLWFLERLDPHSGAYNMPIALALAGRLSPPALAASLSEIVARHEALRTAFIAVNGQPAQAIAPPRAIELPVIDLAALPDEGRDGVARSLARAESRRPFDLSRGPFLRASLLRLAEDHHIALVTLHHIVSDAWSMGVLVRELGELYEAFHQRRSPRLPALPVQYADFAVWQRSWLSGEVLAAQLAWWRSHLSGVPDSLDLPLDRPRPAQPSADGGALTVELSADLSRRLAGLGRANGATLFMVLLAAFQALLARLCAQRDLVVGSPIANRNRLETEGLIGFFVNTLVLRGELAPDLPFADWLVRVRETTLGAYAHQDLPFEKLVEELRPGRNLARSPLFQVLFHLQNAKIGELALSDLKLTPLALEERVTHFDLSLWLAEGTRGLAGELEYRRDLFDPSTVQRLAGHFETLLRGIVENPRERLSELPLLNGAERHQMVTGWNDTVAGAPEDSSLHELFERQVARDPEAPAVIFGEETLTYGELDRRANQLARHLVGAGVAADTPVGICAGRSPDMVIALLAVLKAGGAYLPLDPAYPAERLAWMLEDARAPVLVATEATLPGLPSTGDHRTICLEWERFEIDELSTESLGRRSVARNLAYLIYTSGSTGRPKGIQVEHRSAVWYALAAAAYYGLGAADRVLQFSSFSFDNSVDEIFCPLSCGAAVVLADDDALAPARLLEQCRRQGVTSLSPPTAYWHELALEIAARPESLPPSLRNVSFGGEKVLAERVASWMRTVGPRIQLLNGYGPTEATVVATFHRIGPEPWDGVAEVPIGRPMADVQVYVVDDQLALLPIGVSGELLIGGAGIVRGYLRRPDLTAERFVPDPFGARSGARLYRTGDRVRWRRRRELEYTGRVDHQVKIRGFRIEPGEIEAALVAHPAILDAVVLAVDAPGSGKAARRLCGPRPADQGRPSRPLQDFLEERLPEYMVPSAYRLPRGSAAHAERQGRPPGSRRDARGARVCLRRGVRRPADAGRGTDRRSLRRAAGARAGRRQRQLLRPRRPLSPGHTGGLPPARGVRSRAPAADPVRGADAGGADRGDR